MPKKMDPHVVSLLRRRELENAVHNWAAQLEKEVARHRRRVERHRGTSTWKHFADIWEKQAAETLSLWDLIRRGLDPDQERRFCGRVSLTVRCAAKGHVLGLVYPTCAFPVFVPSVRTLPANSSAETRARSNRSLASAREHFPWALAASRDPWIETFDDDDGGFFYEIRGLSVLNEEWHRQLEEEAEQQGWGRPAFFLLCRCGQQVVASADVYAAVARGDSHLTAVYNG
ncbi:hypothetical protein ACX27O_24990 [Micromonospora sp. SD19]